MPSEVDGKLLYNSNWTDTSKTSKIGTRRFLYATVFIGNLIALATGISIGWTSPVNVKLNDPANIMDNPLGRLITKEEESWIGSLLGVGAIIGPFVAGFLADRIGRKKTLIICSGCVILLAYLLLAFGYNILYYYIGRFCAGFAIGAFVTVLPNFYSEIAEDSNRGAIACSINSFNILGSLFAYLVGPYVSIMWFSLICTSVPAIFIVLFSIFAPESPYFLVAQNDFVGATESLKRLRGTDESGITEELDLVKFTVKKSKDTKVSFMDLFKTKACIKALIISLTLTAFQQFSGIAVILFYTQSIFKATGSSIPSDISSIVVGIVQVVASISTIFLIDRVGRRVLLLTSAIGMLIIEFLLGLYFYLKESGRNVESIYWLPIMCLIIYVIVFHLGYGPVPWTVMAEIFPPNIKALASTTTVAFNWLIGFMITKYFASISSTIGMSGAFWLFAGSCGVSIVFVLTYTIETKGKSFIEIQQILEK